MAKKPWDEEETTAAAEEEAVEEEATEEEPEAEYEGEDEFDADTSDISDEDAYKSTQVEPGLYHLLIQGAEMDGAAVKMDLCILAGENEGFRDKKITHWLRREGKTENGTEFARRHLKRFKIALGLGDGEPLRVSKLPGKQVVGKITLKPGSKNPEMKFPNLDFFEGPWHVNDDRVGDVPKDDDALQEGGYKEAKKPKAKAPAAKPAAAKPAGKPNGKPAAKPGAKRDARM